ncbi:hypothetical protein [Streptomyces viridosporus]|uniref:hypothetical protein n=1 Tax=Streptomyces viridosporus TaxID=67581 RepID=UPI0036FF0D9F
MAAAHQQTPSPAGRERRAVRYVREEGHTCAPAHHLTILETVTDPSGAPAPLHRKGRQRVHAPARNAAIDTTIARRPAAIAPDHCSDLRHRAACDLAGHGVQVRYTWAPRADSGERR